MKRTLITAALPYANGYIHLGHCAGAYLPADIFARYNRLSGKETLFVCGSDEHGVAITIAAEKEGVTPKDIIDKYHYANLDAFQKLGMTFDVYSRTSNQAHHELAREFFQDFLNKGLLVERESEQFYDEKASMFLPDRYVDGICPNCGSDKARGDQCDSCGAYYSQTELKNPISLISGETPILKSTTHWFFKLQDAQEFLENYIKEKSSFWKENVVRQTESWLKAGLSERAITRDLTWGVPIKGIDGIDDQKAEGKALYVWFDAVLGYISATKEKLGEDWKRWWQSEDSEYLAFIGKDNIVFHTLIFPAMLNFRKDAENPYLLPSNVPAHEFLNLEGQKLSKSRNWTIELKDFFVDFQDPRLTDSLRYSIAANFPETKDSDYTWRDFQAKNNNELAAILGNFINRSLQFLNKNFEGIVPMFDNQDEFIKDWKLLVDDIVNGNQVEEYSSLSNNDKAVILELAKCYVNTNANYAKYRFRDLIQDKMNLARAANKYFNDEEPWKSIKTNTNQTAKTMFVCVQLARALSVFFAPLVPNASKQIAMALNSAVYTGESMGYEIGDNRWFDACYPLVKSGVATSIPNILFPRIEDEIVESQAAKLGSQEDKIAKEVKTELPKTPLISIDDFKKIELKTAKIIAAEPIKKSKKLIKLQVEIGDEKRQILAGIGEHYKAEDLIGKTVVVVANLQPAKLMGEVSEGMLLAVNASDLGLTLVTPETDVPSGEIVR